jgi:hypothetical protein
VQLAKLQCEPIKMKKVILFIITIIVLCNSKINAQYRRPSIIGDSIFIFVNIDKRIDTLQPMNISIQLDSVYYDTCNWGNNSLDFEIKLLNNAKLPIYYKSEIYFWDDSGFGSENYQVDNMARINPNKFGILKIHIRNTKRWHFNRQGYYRISYNNKEVNVPISLKIMYKPINCSMTYEERMKTKH